MKNFAHSDQKKRFQKILREFVQVLLSMGLLLLLLYFWGGFLKPPTKRLNCNAEKVASLDLKKYFINRGDYFAGGDLQSSEKAHSYQHSVKLNAQNRYGLGYEAKNQDGDQDLWISVWRYNPEGEAKKGYLACQVGSFYQQTSKAEEVQKSGWEKLSMHAHLPQSVKNETLKIYCTYDGGSAVYFDDLKIDYRRSEK